MELQWGNVQKWRDFLINKLQGDLNAKLFLKGPKAVFKLAHSLVGYPSTQSIWDIPDRMRKLQLHDTDGNERMIYE